MKSIRKIFSVLFIGTGLLCSVNAAEADVGVFISGVPVQREVIGPPRGYQNCYVVPSGYSNGIWINTHRICEYDNSPDGGYWVAGYWQCSRYSRHGVCRDWYWQRSHWVRPGMVEYGVVWHNHPGYGRPGYGRHYDHGGPRNYHDHREYKGYDQGWNR